MPRRTVSLSEDLDARVANVAREDGVSYSAAVTKLLDAATGGGPLPYEAVGEGPGDLSERVEDYLDEMVAEHRDRR